MTKPETDTPKDKMCRWWFERGIKVGEAELIHVRADRDNLREWIAASLMSDPVYVAGVREGVKAVREGRIRPWSEVKRELEELADKAAAAQSGAER